MNVHEELQHHPWRRRRSHWQNVIFLRFLCDGHGVRRAILKGDRICFNVHNTNKIETKVETTREKEKQEDCRNQ